MILLSVGSGTFEDALIRGPARPGSWIPLPTRVYKRVDIFTLVFRASRQRLSAQGQKALERRNSDGAPAVLGQKLRVKGFFFYAVSKANSEFRAEARALSGRCPPIVLEVGLARAYGPSARDGLEKKLLERTRERAARHVLQYYRDVIFDLLAPAEQQQCARCSC